MLLANMLPPCTRHEPTSVGTQRAGEPARTSAQHGSRHTVCIQKTEGRAKPDHVQTVCCAAADQFRSGAKSAAHSLGSFITKQPIQFRMRQACVCAMILSRSSLSCCFADLVCAKALSLAAGLTSLLSSQLLKHSAEHYRGLLLLWQP